MSTRDAMQMRMTKIATTEEGGGGGLSSWRSPSPPWTAKDEVGESHPRFRFPTSGARRRTRSEAPDSIIRHLQGEALAIPLGSPGDQLDPSGQFALPPDFIF